MGKGRKEKEKTKKKKRGTALAGAWLGPALTGPFLFLHDGRAAMLLCSTFCEPHSHAMW